MAHPLTEKITQQLTQQQASGLLRQRKMVGTDPANVDFSHNDYLGLASSTELAQALYQGALTYGVGSKASPLVSGYGAAHQMLEQKLCDITDHQACMLFCSGFSANSALMKTLFDRTDVVIADKLVHASIIDGLVDSGAKLVRYLHNDIDSAARLLAKHPNNVLITESVFSMDGDIAPINALSALCQQHNSWLIVDDAHGFGVVDPRGSAAITAKQVDIQIVTFGKALGCQGAAILASQDVIDFLVANTRHYIYSTALSPANAYLAYAAIELIEKSPQLQTQLNDNISLFRALASQAGVKLTASQTAIQPIIIGDNTLTMTVADSLAQKGFKVGAIRSPTVPVGSARLRITLNAKHTSAQIHQLVAQLALLLIDQPNENP
ncbi:aminotransferase class I/II-fold pyridoxal phosphate-dependent enzyme [Shewanella subflava]|uniref:8-amino-7-oxononanoate synthase n=1 Tax=Shewanella subflava TaxID=2986476 RepID=A0ABT3IEB0_9GAMM|nr:8-amino-7-oxononanoate synthase [Shewanella subflava]MCW3174249.1 8-amino-7-oxononanoate synthase [Shewanella subflava]